MVVVMFRMIRREILRKKLKYSFRGKIKNIKKKKRRKYN